MLHKKLIIQYQQQKQYNKWMIIINHRMIQIQLILNTNLFNQSIHSQTTNKHVVSFSRSFIDYSFLEERVTFDLKLDNAVNFLFVFCFLLHINKMLHFVNIFLCRFCKMIVFQLTYRKRKKKKTQKLKQMNFFFFFLFQDISINI